MIAATEPTLCDSCGEPAEPALPSLRVVRENNLITGMEQWYTVEDTLCVQCVPQTPGVVALRAYLDRRLS